MLASLHISPTMLTSTGGQQRNHLMILAVDNKAFVSSKALLLGVAVHFVSLTECLQLWTHDA